MKAGPVSCMPAPGAAANVAVVQSAPGGSAPSIPVFAPNPGDLRVISAFPVRSRQCWLLEHFHHGTPRRTPAYRAHLSATDCVVSLGGERAAGLLGGGGTRKPRHRRQLRGGGAMPGGSRTALSMLYVYARACNSEEAGRTPVLAQRAPTSESLLYAGGATS